MLHIREHSTNKDNAGESEGEQWRVAALIGSKSELLFVSSVAKKKASVCTSRVKLFHLLVLGYKIIVKKKKIVWTRNHLPERICIVNQITLASRSLLFISLLELKLSVASRASWDLPWWRWIPPPLFFFFLLRLHFTASSTLLRYCPFFLPPNTHDEIPGRTQSHRLLDTH